MLKLKAEEIWKFKSLEKSKGLTAFLSVTRGAFNGKVQ